MRIIDWYAVLLAALMAVLIVARLYRLAHWLHLTAKFVLLKYLTYPLAIPRRYWSSVTNLQILALIIYVAANGLCLGLGTRAASQLIYRSGILASVNIIPLFFGGRTSFIADRLDIPLHVYYFAHHWVGRMVVLQSLLHVGLVFGLAERIVTSDGLTSGIVLIGTLATIAVSSVYPVRRKWYEFFLKTHFILSLATLGSLLWHLLPGHVEKYMYPIIALSLWMLNATYRLWRFSWNSLVGKTRQQQVLISTYLRSEADVSAIKLHVALRRPMEIQPGQYLYIGSNDLDMGHSFQLVRS